MTKRCKHTRAVAVSMIDVETYECRRCGARGVRRLGPSNDAEPAVLVEMRAAAVEAVPGIARLSMTTEESAGWATHFWRDDPKPSGEAGWLTYELSTHVDIDARDRNAWSWDPSRPIAEQLAETARVDAAADELEVALCNDCDDPVHDGECSAAYESSRDAEPDCRDEDESVDVAIVTLDRGNGPEPVAQSYVSPRYPAIGLRADAEVCACTGDALESEACEVAP